MSSHIYTFLHLLLSLFHIDAWFLTEKRWQVFLSEGFGRLGGRRLTSHGEDSQQSGRLAYDPSSMVELHPELKLSQIC